MVLIQEFGHSVPEVDSYGALGSFSEAMKGAGSEFGRLIREHSSFMELRPGRRQRVVMVAVRALYKRVLELEAQVADLRGNQEAVPN